MSGSHPAFLSPHPSLSCLRIRLFCRIFNKAIELKHLKERGSLRNVNISVFEERFSFRVNWTIQDECCRHLSHHWELGLGFHACFMKNKAKHYAVLFVTVLVDVWMWITLIACTRARLMPTWSQSAQLSIGTTCIVLYEKDLSLGFSDNSALEISADRFLNCLNPFPFYRFPSLGPGYLAGF